MKPSLFEKKNKLQRRPTGAPPSSTSVSRAPPAEEGASSCESWDPVEISVSCGRVSRAWKDTKWHSSAGGGGCVCPAFVCCTYRQGLNRCFTVTATVSSTESTSDPKDAPFAHLFFLFFTQGPQRHRKESDSSGASGDSRAQQTSHNRFNEGGTSLQSQGGSREHWVQAPAVGRHTRIIQQLRKSNPLCTRVEPVVNLFELCAVQAP